MKKILIFFLIACILGGSAMVLLADEALLSLEKKTFIVGEAIEVSAVGSGTDWIGIYYPNEPHSIRWQYVVDFGSGNSFDITQGVDNGGAPDVLSAGSYIVRLMPNDSTNIAEALAEIAIEIVEDEDDLPKTPASATYTPKKAGFAAGTIRVTLAEGDRAADIIPYWANESGVLADYTPLAKFKVENGEAVCELSDNLYIPTGATALWVYTATKSGTLCDEPFVIALPENAATTPKDGLLMEFQVISDAHVVTDPEHIHNRHFKMMLNDVVTNSPDSQGIFIVGDMVDNGYRQEFETLLSMYEGVAGAPPLYMALGNHELKNGAFNAKIQQYLNFATLPDGTHPKTSHYDFTLGGYHFVFLGNDDLVDELYTTLDPSTIEWLDQTLAKDHEAGKPIFLFCHQSLYDTVAGSLEGQGWNGVWNEEPLREVLKKHPDVILFNGHSHWILDSFRTMYIRSEELPTIFNTSSAGYLWTSYDVIEGVAQTGSEGYYIRVYEDFVEVLGRDFANGKWVSSAQFVVPYQKDAEDTPVTSDPITTEEIPVTEAPVTSAPSTDTPSDGDGEGGQGALIALLSALAVSVAAIGAVIFFRKRGKNK